MPDMTQDERWLIQYNEVMAFMAENHRRPSKFVDEERGMRNWWKHQQKLMNAGELKEDRKEFFNKVLQLGEKYRHVNQYQCVRQLFILSQMQATTETIQNLVKNASLAVNDLYPVLKQDMEVMRISGSSVPVLLKLVPEMRMNVKFILIDLESTFRALMSAESGVEKRLQLKNLRADMHESYKLLYGFGKAQQHTAWYRIGSELNAIQTDGQDEAVALLKQVYDAISEVLLKIGIDDKENRDLSYHYDDDLLKVYQNILDSCDEEGACKQLISVFDLLQAILLFCDEIELVEGSRGYNLPEVSKKADFLISIQKLFAEKLSEHGKLQDALKTILNGASRVDDVARMRKGIVNIKAFAKEKMPDSAFPEADEMDDMANVHLLLQIMLVDIASIVNGYLNSGSGPEYALNLRRLTITRVSTLSHLYGYGEFERNKSLWGKIIVMIPSDSDALLMESRIITEELDGLIDDKDKELRTLYAHLMDKKKNNVPEIIASIKEANPYAELKKAESLIVVTSRIQRFLKDLMDKMANDAHQRAEESTARFLAQINSIRELADNPKCPQQLKETINNQMDFFENIAKGDFSDLRGRGNQDLLEISKT